MEDIHGFWLSGFDIQGQASKSRRHPPTMVVDDVGDLVAFFI